MKLSQWLWLGSLLHALVAKGAPPLDAESYNQWQAALTPGEATPPERITALPGFVVERLRSSAAGEGSWVAMAFDDRGRVIISREDKGLLRLNLQDGKLETIDTTLEEVRGLLFVKQALYAHANNSHALYRLRDSDGDDNYDEVTKVRETPGGVGHGRNQLTLGPDGAIYLICGDDVRAPDGGFDATSPFQHFQDDKLLPAPWDKFSWSDSSHAPCGHLVRTDTEGKKWEIICGGLRNPFGIDFDQHGEAFTYDADIEWDIGLPSYRPTRIIHLVSGVDYGWRGASRALPAWYPDTAAAALNIGKGSPTSCVFGHHGKWPEPWRSTFFALDWAYGRIHAVSLSPEGATFQGQSQIFLEGKPLNVTSAAFGPDGEMYFLTGGRRTQSGLYRVRYVGDATSVLIPAENVAATKSCELRRQLEAYHGKSDPSAVAQVWPQLANPDAWVRRAARIALEFQPVDSWLERAGTESSGVARAEIALALARVGGESGAKWLPAAFAKLPLSTLPEQEQKSWLRALQILRLRSSQPLEAAVVAQLEAAFPLGKSEPDRLLCELLVAAGSSPVLERSLPLCGGERTQEEKLHYLIATGLAPAGWTLPTRRGWLQAFTTLRTEATGGPAVPQQLDYLRAHFLQGLTDEDRKSLAADIEAAERAAATVAVPVEPRPFVRAWTLDDLLAEIAKVNTTPDLDAGKKLFAAASCIQCHRVAGEGGQIGPELTAISKRFDRKALLESVIEPWKVVADPYRMASITMKSGVIYNGRLTAEEPDALKLITNPIEPDYVTTAPRRDIDSTLILSAMPPGLFHTLTASEVRNFLAWLESVP